jgi:hypothetical protein
VFAPSCLYILFFKELLYDKKEPSFLKDQEGRQKDLSFQESLFESLRLSAIIAMNSELVGLPLSV